MTRPASLPYAVYGVRVLSELPMPAPRTAGAPLPPGRVDLRVRRLEGTAATRPPASVALYRSPRRAAGGEPALELFAVDGDHRLRIAGVAEYEIADDEIRVRLLAPGAEDLAGLHLLGTVLAFWLERRGLPCLHASAVVVGGAALGFLSANRGGKSSLAVALMRQGHPLLTDDLLAVERGPEGGVQGRPGYPQVRLWPEEAERFLTGRPDLPRVHPAMEKVRVSVGAGGEPGGLGGSFCPEPRPLARLYLPERREASAGRSFGSGTAGGITGSVVFEPVPAARALVELLRRSFLPRLTEAAGWQPERLRVLSELVEGLAVRRFLYPAGYEHLEGVAREVLAEARLES